MCVKIILTRDKRWHWSFDARPRPQRRFNPTRFQFMKGRSYKKRPRPNR